MKKPLILFAVCLSAVSVTGQNVNNPNLPANIDWKEDTTEIVTVADIVKTQQDLTVKNFREAHYQDVWARNNYVNVAYNSVTLSPDDNVPTGMGSAFAPDFKSNWGLSVKLGTSYKLHKNPISNVLQFYIDYSYIDLNINHFGQEGSVPLYDTSVKTPGGDYYTPWNLEKYEFNYGMSVGPSISLAPFTSTNSKGLHYLRFNIYYHLGYHISLLNLISDEAADANIGVKNGDIDKVRTSTKLDMGHGLISSFGFSVTWKFIGLGYEYRAASLKYKPLESSLYGSDDYKFKNSTSRVFLQFRM